MSDFNTWEEIQEWMQMRVDDYYEMWTVEFPHPIVEGLRVEAALSEDAYRVGWYLELYQDDLVVIRHYITDSSNYNLFDDVERFIEGLKAFCPDPTTVTAVKDDGYDG